MIEFKGAISEDIRQREIKKQANAAKFRFIAGAIASGVLLILVLVAKYLLYDPKPTLQELFSGEITIFFILLFVVFVVMVIVSIVKPMYNSELDKKSPFSVRLDNDKIVYEPSEGFGKREFNYSNLKKIVDEGDYYLLVSKEHNIRLICQKDLLIQGSLKEFDEYFNKIISRKGEATKSSVENKKDLQATEEAVVVKEEDAQVVEGGENPSEVVEEKTFTNDKFKKSKTRNEKSFKFALIGIMLGVAAVALTPVVVTVGINFAVNSITYIFNTLFYGGFVIEFFTFLFACIIVFLSTIFLFVSCFLVMPVIALLSLIFPIYQLVAVNHRWFSWVSLAVGIASIFGCLALAVVTLQSL